MDKRISRRPLYVAGFFIIMIVSVAITWRHWLWQVRNAHVWIDGKSSDDVKVYRCPDGRYLIHTVSRLPGAFYADVVVPGSVSPIDTLFCSEVGKAGWTSATIWLLPGCAYCRDVPIPYGPLYGVSVDPRVVTRQKDGFTFLGDYSGFPVREVPIPARYRVVLK